jgi:ribosomal protein L16 Arg81 hydroxylase
MLKDLSSLLSPFSVPEFVARYYSLKPLLIHGTPEKGSELFSWAVLNTLLNSAPLSALNLRVVRRGAFVNVADPLSLARECRTGATLIVDNFHEKDVNVGELATSLSAELGERVAANLYYPQPGFQGFDGHYDTHDVFVLHLQGNKAWRIYDSPVPFPLPHETKTSTTLLSNTVLEAVLQPGDLLYIPRGYWHEATAQNEVSVHLTIGIHVRTAVDFMTWIIDGLRENIEWRMAFPLDLREEIFLDTFIPESHVIHCARLKEIITAKLSDPDLLREYREFCISQDKPVRAISLPTMTQNLPQIRMDTAFLRHTSQRAVIRRLSPSRFEVVVWGRIFDINHCQEELLRAIFSRVEFCMRDLVAVAPSMTFSGVAEVISVFLREGIIELAF